ncbi:hypothetical protein CYMTET_5790 [Cymbomonas tetramitiformis]|uniref:Uncharacterized protein n=1 Tax=Cymbomonas tetramitiformis TaxID=36881 RepID=A0AAE0GYI2_9CHLO|nr:hypothetical protein CYMTET_5790 [Cymbomonas tetramitiformis]
MVRRTFPGEGSVESTVLVDNTPGRRPYLLRVNTLLRTWDWPPGHPVIRGDGRVCDDRFEDIDYDPATFEPEVLMGQAVQLSSRTAGDGELEPIPEFTGIFARELKLAWVVMEPTTFCEFFDSIMTGCRLSLQRHIKWYEEWQHLSHSVGRILLAETCGQAYARAFLNVFWAKSIGPPTLETNASPTWAVISEVRKRTYVPSLQQVLFEYYLEEDVCKAGRQPWEHFTLKSPPNTFRLRELLSCDELLLKELVQYAFPSDENEMAVGPLLEKWGCIFVFTPYVLTQQIEGDFNRIDNTGHKNASVETISAVVVGSGINSIDIDTNADAIKNARKVVRERKKESKLEQDAMHLRDVQTHVTKVKAKQLDAIEKARKREAAEVARAVKELCGSCAQAKRRVVNPEQALSPTERPLEAIVPTVL